MNLSLQSIARGQIPVKVGTLPSRPRIRRELQRRGFRVNAKKVYRLLRKDNLLCASANSYDRVEFTTESNHGLQVYPNRAAGGADITYIRLEGEFIYLAVILDAYSRRGIGWALDRTLEATLTIEALQMALRRRKPAPGLVHHFDRGVQYASRDYTGLLQANGIVLSMSRKGNPWDTRPASRLSRH